MRRKHSMISRACKWVILEAEMDHRPGHRPGAAAVADDEDVIDLAQTIYQHPTDSASQLAARYCRPFCPAEGAAPSAADDKEGKQEL